MKIREIMRRTMAIGLAIAMLLQSQSVVTLAETVQADVAGTAVVDVEEETSVSGNTGSEDIADSIKNASKLENKFDLGDKQIIDSDKEKISPTVPVWDGAIATSFSGGSGTEDDPYQIATVEELAYMLQYDYEHGKHCYALVNDVYINKMGEYTHKWNGYAYGVVQQIEGNGHSIYGLYNSTLLGDRSGDSSNVIIKNLNLKSAYYDTLDYGIGFGDVIESLINCHIYGDAVIKRNSRDRIYFMAARDLITDCTSHMNLTIDECEEESSAYTNTLIVPFYTMYGKSVIKNCTNYGNICAVQSHYSVYGVASGVSITSCTNYGHIKGGICAYGIGEAEFIEGCTNIGKVESDGYTYGIGCVKNYGTGEITKCINKGDLISSYNSGQVCGIGEAVQFTECENYGNLSAAINGSNSRVSGIGNLSDYTGYKIEKCKNWGDLSGQCVAGISYMYSGYESKVEVIDIKYCENYGNITASQEAAGIIQNIFIYGTQEIIIESCINEGTIVVQGKEDGVSGIGAGVVGSINGSTFLYQDEDEQKYKNRVVNIKNCGNKGDINVSGGNAYGVIATCCMNIFDKESGALIINCYNSGNLFATFKATGIVGDMGCDEDVFVNNTISQCYNTGNISADVRACGIACSMRGKISDCYNSGDINGFREDIGLVFSINDGEIINCYNAGKFRNNREKGYYPKLVWQMKNSVTGNLYNISDYKLINEEKCSILEYS